MWLFPNKYINKFVWLLSPVNYNYIYICCALVQGFFDWMANCTFILIPSRFKTSLLLMFQVCEILEENALTSKSANGECEPWVVSSRLRDHLLLPRERKNPLLWKKVASKLFSNSLHLIIPFYCNNNQSIIKAEQVDSFCWYS